MKPNPIIQIRDLHHSYGEVPVLRGVDLSIGAGEFVALMGESGSGKSTLLNCIGGLDRPSSGSLIVGQQELVGLSLRQLAIFRRSRVSFIFQDFNLVPTLSVRENVELPVRLRRESVRSDEISALLDRVGLAKRSAHRPAQLSGGEMQRCAIARALAVRPTILLADEPTGSLDQRNADTVMSLLIELQKERSLCILMATHSRRLAGMAGRIVRVEDGVVS